MMKLLHSIYNTFPNIYKEYCINDLTVDSSTERNWTLIWKQNGRPGKWLAPDQLLNLKNLHESITTRGLFHPIIIWSPDEKILDVYIGRERVWIAKKEGYTHISAYRPKTIEERDKVYKYTLHKDI